MPNETSAEPEEQSPFDETEDKLEALRSALTTYEEAFKSKSTAPSSARAANKKSLTGLIEALTGLGYTRNSLAAALAIDPLTVDRWKNGTAAMKDHSFRAVQNLAREILAGRPQRAMKVSSTGFVTWEYIFKRRRPHAQSTWYICEDRLLLARSKVIREELRDLFSRASQEQRAHENRSYPLDPKMIYVFPAGSGAESSLTEWMRSLRKMEDDEPGTFRGTVLGLKVENRFYIPWFFPTLRTAILDIDGSYEGYMRIRVPASSEIELFRALGTSPEKAEQRPWLTLHSEVTEGCYARLEERYGAKVERWIKEKQDGNDFGCGILDVDKDEEIEKERKMFL